MKMAGTKRAKIRKGDQVVVIAGKDYNRFDKRGKEDSVRIPARGRVLAVDLIKGKVKVEGVGIIKKHTRANQANNRGGGIIDMEAFIDISNVALIDPQTGKASRARYDVGEDGSKTRVATGSGQPINK